MHLVTPWKNLEKQGAICRGCTRQSEDFHQQRQAGLISAVLPEKALMTITVGITYEKARDISGGVQDRYVPEKTLI